VRLSLSCGLVFFFFVSILWFVSPLWCGFWRGVFVCVGFYSFFLCGFFLLVLWRNFCLFFLALLKCFAFRFFFLFLLFFFFLFVRLGVVVLRTFFCFFFFESWTCGVLFCSAPFFFFFDFFVRFVLGRQNIIAFFFF